MSWATRYMTVLLFLVGLFFVISLFFPVNPLSSQTDNRLQKIVGVSASVVGLLLAQSTVVGETRLREWEASIRKNTREKSAHGLVTWQDVVQRLIVIMGGLFFLAIGVCSWLFYVMDAQARPVVGIDYPIILAAFAVTISPLVVILLSREILWLMVLPYRILDKVVEQKKMQSTLVLLGIIISIFGILLTVS
jgi:hypothetical protein